MQDDRRTKENRKIGLLYACNSDYVFPTIVSMTSVLENNKNASEDRKVEICLLFMADNWSVEDELEVRKQAEKYGCFPTFLDTSDMHEEISGMGFKTYGGSYSAYYQMFFAQYFDYDMPILYLEGDVVMATGTDLHELSNWSFEEGEKEYSFACNVDPENSTFMRKGTHLSKNKYHICNVGVILINPQIYRKHQCYKMIKKTLKEVGDFSFNDDLMFFNYTFRNEIMVLPLKFQVYPAYRFLSHRQLVFLFTIDRKTFYMENEYNEAIKEPVFIHFVYMITGKPWQSDITWKYPPYGENWNTALQKTTFFDSFELIKCDYTKSELLRRWLFLHFRIIWLLLCRIGNTVDWKKRLKTIRDYSFFEED